MVISGMVSHSRQTIRLIGFQSLCSTRFQGSSVASLAFSPIRVSPPFLAFALLMVGASYSRLNGSPAARTSGRDLSQLGEPRLRKNLHIRLTNYREPKAKPLDTSTRNNPQCATVDLARFTPRPLSKRVAYDAPLDKGNPVVRWMRKVTDLVQEAAGLPKVVTR